MEINEFQKLMSDLYRDADDNRGIASTIAWLTEELGELSQAVRKGSKSEQEHELGDVLAWLASLANQLEIDLESTTSRFVDSCPSCAKMPCGCKTSFHNPS